MGICPDCGGWIDEGDCSCSCGSTRGTSSYYEDDCDEHSYSSGSWNYNPEAMAKIRREYEEERERRRLEEEIQRKQAAAEKAMEERRRKAEIERRRKEREEQERREREENEKNPMYLVRQIEKIKTQIYSNRKLLFRGPEHLTGTQQKIDNAFAEALRLQEKLDAFEINKSEEYDILKEEIKVLKHENRDLKYLLSHMDDKYCDNARKVYKRNASDLKNLEKTFDELYPKRGLFNRRDNKPRSKINID